MSSFGVNEGRFLGYIVTEEGLRADPGRIQTIILSPTPRSPNQIRSLFLQLTAISKFIMKLAELKHPLRKEPRYMYPVASDKEVLWSRRASRKDTKCKRRGNAQPKQETPHKINSDAKGLEIIPRLEEIEEGLGIKIILASPEEKMYLYAIRLKFKASSYAMDYEALLAGLAASANQGMKDLHVFIDSLTLVAQVEGNHTLATKQERRYKKEIMDATVPFYRFRVTHLLKILNLKAEVLTGLATINLEYLNQEVSIGIKTRPSVEDTSSSKKGKTTNNAPEIKPKCTREASGSK
ncbi:reverse transcriptase domain-containing protein [Tanacetum coccineum]|uniref:Reverse transcriptase domain-containing protein n=1 Tax=Tanacetum coccineum TaxID=301880 RepID=A0ABQ5A5H8_9ASTR